MDQKTHKTVAASLRSAAAKLQAAGPSPKVKASAARKVKAASDEFPALDPKSAMAYFDLHFEDYNLEEDQGPNADEDGAQRAADFLALGKGKLDQAGRAAEDAAMKEIGDKLKKAGLNVRLGNEGHGSDDALVMNFGVDSSNDVKKLVAFVNKNTGGGDDVIYLNAPYMEARGFVLYPNGVNNGGFGFGAAGDGDIDEWLEAQGDAVKGSTKVRASWATAEEFIDFLEGTLIPDLKESGSEFTAEDFEKLVGMLRSGKKDAQFINFLKKTLIPDLKKSGMVETAKDFVSGLKFLKAAADQPTKLKGNAMQKATKKVKAASLDDFERQYLETALWSSNDESDESGGEPFDSNYGIEDIAPTSVSKAQQDCKKFRQMAGELLDGVEDSQAGHDFWLTRNGHGAGFWDRQELKENNVGKKLTDLCKKFGEINPMLGDDGQIHFE